MAKLTKRLIDQAEIRDEEYFLWCSELPGFGVRIYPSGARAYLVQYRAGGRTRRAKIGLHGRLTPDEARKEAIALLGAVAKGGDPAEERATRRAAMTVSELCARYFAAADKGLILGKGGAPKKPSTLSRDRSRMQRHILPLLGNRRVADLTTAEINRFMRAVAAGETAIVEKTNKLRGKAIVEGGRGVAARTVGQLGGILSFAVSEGVIAANPVRGVKRPSDGRRSARLTPETYRGLGEAIEKFGAEGANKTAIRAIKLLLLTGCRKGEIERLRWEEVDFAGRAFRFVDTKEGASVRPIGSAVFDILGPAPVNRSGWVLSGRDGGRPYGGLPGAWRRLAKSAGLGDVTLHTLRHSFASVAADVGYAEATVAAMIGHAAGSITGRYQHALDAVLLAAADRVSRAIANHLAGKSAEVIQLDAARA